MECEPAVQRGSLDDSRLAQARENSCGLFMKNPAQEFLQELGNLPPDTFESRFSRASNQLGLAGTLTRNELSLLYDATFRATLCNLAINGLGALAGKLPTDQEKNRCKVERDYMTAREIFYASPGWQMLDEAEQETIEKVFLSVAVADEKLAW